MRANNSGYSENDDASDGTDSEAVSMAENDEFAGNRGNGRNSENPDPEYNIWTNASDKVDRKSANAKVHSD